MFENQTAEPRIEYGLANHVNEVLARSGSVVLTEQQNTAEALLIGKITNYSNSALAYDTDDNISEYRAKMVVDFKLVRNEVDQPLLWEDTVRWSSDYVADDQKSTQEDLEDTAIDELSLRLAEELYEQLFNDF